MIGERTAGGSGAMFDGIAPRYDLVNRVISFGMDRRWRRLAVEILDVAEGDRVLDLATGTGDVALEVLRQTPSAEVVGLDPSTQMLAIAERKLAGIGPATTLVEGDAQDLPFEAGCFDRVIMAFGIRNVPDRALALGEIARVLRPGGRLVILELSEPRRGVVAPFARTFIHDVVPRIGALLSGASEYRYLEASIAAFPAPEAFAQMIAQAGFGSPQMTPLSFGAATLFDAVRQGGET